MAHTQPHSVRLFPRNKGTAAYELSGIAARCDWVVLSDSAAPRACLLKSRQTGHPRHVFLSMRNPWEALRFFSDVVLPELSSDFILVSGSEDVTLPRQIDKRWPPFDAETRTIIDRITALPNMRHWFAENLDQRFHERVSPLPTGFVFPDNAVPAHFVRPEVRPLAARPLRVLCAHRERTGEQWATRKTVSQMARTDWAHFTTTLSQEVDEADFLDLVHAHSFVLCVEGGGLDPSPKAWQAIQYGAIPIFRQTPVAAAYDALPCVTIDTWLADRITVEKLSEWKMRLLDQFDLPERRGEVLDRLSLDYWWDRVTDAKFSSDTGDGL